MADIPSTLNAVNSANTLAPTPSDTAKAVKKAGDLKSNLENIIKNGEPWPQTLINPGLGNSIPSIGFLPPILIRPTRDFVVENNPNLIGKKYINYEFEDWLGQKITNNGLIPVDTRARFEESKNIPKTDLNNSPYSTRDNYLIFNDRGTDYFKHGLQIINNLTPIENPINGKSDLRLNQFKNTPFENNDPIIFGFEIVIDVVSSPLLNGSVANFLNNYEMISEIKSRIPIYEDFKQQFVKFFKTNGTIRINNQQINLSKSQAGYPNSENTKNSFQSGRQAYMSHYLKKVENLELLTESNKTDTKKYIVDYRKDTIKLEFTEDVSMSLGTLAHLYKLMYWSRPNGKSLVPENLLRFNCDIIISEVRNFNRVKKAIESQELEVIKDNLSRYVYSLKECQFYFNAMPHPTSVDLSEAPKTFDASSIEFDYKYSTVKFEKFMETSNGFGQYVGYDSGAIWKIGNRGERANRGNTFSRTDTSIPRFYTIGQNTLNQNGVLTPFLINSYGRIPIKKIESIAVGSAVDKNKEKILAEQKAEVDRIGKTISTQASSILSLKKDSKIINFIDRIKESTKKNVKVQIANLVNNRINLLSRTINKLGINIVGGKGVRPPNNVYAQDRGPVNNALNNISDRFFYDVRNELVNFAGGSLSNFLNNGITSFNRR